MKGKRRSSKSQTTPAKKRVKAGRRPTDKQQGRNSPENEFHQGTVNITPHQWKRGQSGNPAGRPRKHLSLTSILKEELSKDDASAAKKLILKVIKQAKEGNLGALKEIWDRLEGKTKEATQLESLAPKVDVENAHARLFREYSRIAARRKEASTPRPQKLDT